VRSSEEGRDPVRGICEVLCRCEENFETPHVEGARADVEEEHCGWVCNTKANYSPYRLIRCCGGGTERLTVGLFAF